MAVADLVLNFLAKDNASAVLSKVKGQTDRLRDSTEKLNRASQLLGGAAVLGFAAVSVKAYADAEKSQIRLQEAYRKFPALADVNIESLRALNTALQDKTGSDDDDLAAAEANLAMYNLTGTQISQLIPLVNDLAVAQNVDLATASKTVGKALLGNAKGLKGVGIEFKATGDRAKDTAALMELLGAQVGGAGDAFGATAAGGMARASKAFSDLQEEVGKQLVPALSSVLQAVLPVLRAFNGLSDSVKGPIVWLGVAGAAALVLAPKLLGIVTNLRLIGLAGGQAAAGLTATTAAANGAAAASGRASLGLGRMGGAMKGLGVAGVALAVGLPLVGSLVSKIGENMFGAAPSAESLRTSLIGIVNGADPDKIGNFGGKLHDLGAEIEHLDNPGVFQRVEDFFGSLAGQGGGQGRNQVLRDIILINEAIAQMAAEGDIQGARKALDALEKSALDSGASAEAVHQQYATAEEAIAAAGRAAAATAGDMGEVTTAVDQTTAAWKAYFAIQADGHDESNRARARDEAAGLRRTDVEIARARDQAAADAMNQRAQDALATWNDTIAAYQSAKQKLQELTRARADEIRTIGSQLTAGGKLNAVFDMNAYAAATDKAKQARLGLADAEKAVREAKGDVRRAKTPEELNAAIAAEAQANRKLAQSRAEVAAADKAAQAAKLTPKNLLSAIRSKLGNIKSFYNDLVALRKRKLPMSLIKQLIDAGPIEGDQLAKALLSATPADFNAIINAEKQLDNYGLRVGGIVGDADYNGLIAGQQGVVANARANAAAAGNQVVQFRMYLDGREVAVALKAYRQSIGGTPLGLG